jgi:hypothetical protein
VNDVWAAVRRLWVPVGAVLLGLGTAIFVVVTSADHPLSQRETALFQIIEVGLTLVGAFFVGQRGASAAAADIVRPHAKSAFRRLTSLYEGLGRLGRSIDDRRSFLERVSNKAKSTVDMAHVEAQLDILAVQVIAELATANDAMEDWRDLVPDEVAMLERAAASGSPINQAFWSPGTSSIQQPAGFTPIPAELLAPSPPELGPSPEQAGGAQQG